MAFQCLLDKCPRSNDPETGCHLWWEFMATNNQTGEQFTKKGCVLSQDILFNLLKDVSHAANVSTENATRARNSADKAERAFREGTHILSIQLQDAKDRFASLTSGVGRSTGNALSMDKDHAIAEDEGRS